VADKLSTLPEVKSKLAELFTARFPAPAAATDVVVQRGLIDPPALNMVEIFEGRINDRDFRQLRPQPHGVRESFEVTIRITAMSSAQVSLADAEDAAWAIADELDGAHRADITLGVAGVEWTKLERADQRFWRFDQYRGAVIILTLTGQSSFN
jgi:hypothetical protein